MSVDFGWGRGGSSVLTDVYCKALMWQNHSSLCSAPHCFTSDVSPSPYKPTEFLSLRYHLFYTYRFVRSQYSFKRRDTNSTLLFVMYFFFFKKETIWYMVFIFFDSGCLKKQSCLCHCVAVCFAALLLTPHEHVCKYQPLNARAQNTNM